jgi:foldase protein PrsA
VNNSKKLQVKKVKTDKNVEKKPIPKISLPWAIVSSVLIVVLIGALLFDQLYVPAVLKVDGKKYTMKDLTYYFYNIEYQYNYYDSLFGGSGAYWDMVADEKTGKTYRDTAKDEAIQSVVFNEVIYNQAVSEGYTLTEEEKATISKNADTTLSSGQFTDAQIRKNGFTKKYLTDIMGKATLVARYRQDKIATLNIDKEAIKAGIIYDIYRQYDIQYIFASTKTTDADGNSVDMTADEKKSALDEINSVYDKAKTTEDWSTLIPEGQSYITYKDTNFIPSSTAFSADFKNMMTKMADGEISTVYDDPTTGYYIVRMVKNNDSASYDSAVQSAITKAEDEGFTKIYNEQILPKHTSTVYDKALQKYKMGTITL